MKDRVGELDLLFQSVLARFFTIKTRQPASGAVTFAQMRVLWTLELHGPSFLGEVARMIGVGNSTATELTDRLVRGGYILRTPSADDRRQVRLSLRPRGLRMLADFARRRRERFRRLLRAIGPREADRMADALRVVNGVLSRWRGEA